MAPIALTISTGSGASQYYQFGDDFLLADLLAMVIADLGDPNDDMKCVKLFKNGHDIVQDESRLQQTLKDVGIENDDMLLYVCAKSAPSAATTSTPSSSTSASALQSTLSKFFGPVDPAVQQQLGNLVKSIKLPPNMSKKAATATPKVAQDPMRNEAKRMYEAMSDDRARSVIAQRYPELHAAYEKDPKNFEEFVVAFRKMSEEYIRKERLMADPSSAEGQKLIQERIAQANIDHSYQLAMEHNPEAYIQVSMLYINMTINGHPVKAFVDSGAQVSVMSAACARRCNLEHLIDRRFNSKVVGVGGSQNFEGKIHLCQVQIEEHIFPCYFDVLADRDMDLLLGLNILRRHQCSLDLKQNKLIFGDGTSTPFLNDKEVNDYLVSIGRIPASDGGDTEVTGEVEPDADKVAQVVGLGFSAEDAAAELKRTGNNVDNAVQNLFAKKGDAMEE